VRTGKGRIFPREEITVQSLLASACRRRGGREKLLKHGLDAPDEQDGTSVHASRSRLHLITFA